MQMTMRLLFLVFILLLFSCRYQSPDRHNKAASPARIDTIRINKIITSADTNIKVLTTSIFHEGEIDTNFQRNSWKGLFTKGNKCYLLDTKVSITRAFDPLIDKPGVKTGIDIEAGNKDTTILLISGIALKNIPVKKLTLPKTKILPGEKQDFKYNGILYSLYGTGKKKPVSPGSNDYEVTDYKLFIQATLNSHHYIQLLVSTPFYEGPFHTQIKFVGDIDNDGIPDFIIDTSNYYGSENSTLFLSGPSKGKALYTIVGEVTGTA